MQPQFSSKEGDINLSESRQQWLTRHTDAATTALLAADAKVFLHQSLSTPCMDVLSGAAGIYIINHQGKKYMDFHGNSVHQLGYQNKYITDRVKAQMDTLAFSPRRFTNQPAIRLAERLTTGELSRVLFAPGGTSAIGMALKLARVVTGKYKTISMYDSFHGASMDSISVGGEYQFHQDIGPLLPGNIHVPPPDTQRGIWKDEMAYVDYIEYVIEKEGDIGALVAETIRSTDVIIPSTQYWKRLREICTRHGVLLILDEIPICMGRTGTLYAWQQYDIVPDIVVLGKGLGAGLVPMAAMLCKEEFNKAAHISLGHYTHEKNPLGAAAALAALDYMEEYKVLDHVMEMEAHIRSRLKSYSTRGKGMLWAIEADNAEQALYRCLEQGLSFKVSSGSVLSLYPPLITTKEEMDHALDIIINAI
ncbi:aspartate aminotransferase family protein [[Flexibacter] sp. ATCC 35208]|uniref:(R)-1-hydroxy-2-aminoethylphosphonate ammonia-lyase n=1 Tax=[Flexibacter] sp. ATCC 35208 TaxID=1936242 RepID=UPI0009D052FD|nr:aspartate aminotransferase family protein [[Flexibacter] sp. ATCC 35208]OMP77129.1 aspartate aminotransferase family protein [[Flexibacter] sp. ATCC 35208]